MKSLFRGLEERRREDSIKSNLIHELRNSAKELLNEHQEEGVLRSTEVSNSLVTTLEAIFIHGLKETIMSKFSSVMAGPDQTPEPEFWSLVLVFSHRDIIQQVHKLTQITTDIGRCRAWIRLVLNDALLPSYVESISVQNSALGPYFKKTAFLRDSPMLSHLLEVVTSVSNVTFEFPTNSCLLNYWSTPPLLMAGLWTPPMKVAPSSDPDRMDVASDIAAELPDETERSSILSPYSAIEQILYDEDEALKIILGTPVQDSLLKTMEDNKVSVETSDSSTQIDTNDVDILEQEQKNRVDSINIGNELNEEETSFLEQTDQLFEELPPAVIESEIPVEEEQQSKTENYPSPKRKVSDNAESFALLLENYNLAGSSNSPREHQNNLENILQTYDLMSDAMPPLSDSTVHMSASLIIEQELKNMVNHLGKFMSESGLLSQNFLCKRCNQPIGITFAAKICGLTGHYYCTECFDEKESVIPARILHNWDFSKHAVSGKAFAFLEDVQAHPLLNVRLINPRLYLIVPEMEELQKKRMKLNILRMFLMTCREPVIESLKKQLWPREYLYLHIHVYSISDLLEIPSLTLDHTLTEVIKFCELHVINCQLCSQKGFICEICNSKQIIYPFHLDTTYRCSKCSLVIHAECKAQIEECPKCLRIQKRTN